MQTLIHKLAVCAICFFSFSQIGFSQDTYHVKTNGNDTNDGLSWGTAFQTLQKALDEAGSGDGIWVAAGTYKPTSGTDQNISFAMKNGVAIYGGFPSSGNPTFGQRNWTVNETILSGDIGTLGDDSDNSYHVVLNSNNNIDGSALLDGFTITAGNASSHKEGGGMYNGSSSPTVANCTFSGNSAGDGGGGMYNYSSSPTVTNCVFSENSVEDLGGGGMYNEASSPTVSNCSFSGNTSSNGGGMYNSFSSPTVTDCTFSGNTEGGMKNYNSSPTVSGCTFSGNSGSGMENSNASPTVSDCTFSGNSAVTGGGMANWGGSAPVVTNCLFSGNSSTNDDWDGGGMANYSSSPTVSNCTFIGNSAEGIGGGMSNSYGSPVVTNCIFNGNSAFQGGGIFSGGSSPITVTNCTFSGNMSDHSGGGMYSSSPNSTLTNCTFSMNSANSSGGGLYNGFLPLAVTNCIFWENGDEIAYYAGNAPDITYSIVQGGFTGTGNLDEDPLFVSSTDLHLQSCSPAIDAGTDSGAPSTDLNGNARPHDGDGDGTSTTDLGAYEFQGVRPLPDAKCKNQTVQLDEDGNGSIAVSQLNNGSTGCGPLALDVDGGSSISYDCDDLNSSPITVTLTVTDVYVKEDNCNATITIEDNIKPNVVCKNKTIELDANGNGTITEADVVVSKSDNCGTPSISLSKSTFVCQDIDSETITITADDGNGNQKNCTATITVVDNITPTATCPAPVPDVVLGTNGNGSLPANIGDGSSTDNCSATETSPALNFTCADIGAQNVTLTADDGNGNTHTAICSFNVVDNITPTATCPAPVPDVVLDANGNGSLPANIGDGSSTDNCSATETSPALNFTCADTGAQNVTLTAADGNGNTHTAICSFNVVDNITPTATCPAPVPDVVLDANGNGSLPANIGDGSSTDNCSATETSPALNFTCADIGAQNVSLTADDGNGNTHTAICSFNVVDNTTPTALCKNITVQLDNTGQASIGVADIDDGSYDNCTVANIEIIDGQTAYGCGDVDEGYVVTLQATDGTGLAHTCTATVTVSDNDLPDDDCDGSANICDVCPGGDDSVDNNNDGTPDCSQFLPYNDYSNDWKCANNKLNICHLQGNGNRQTLCVNKNAIATHLGHGDWAGPCQSCNGQNYMASGNDGTNTAEHCPDCVGRGLLKVFPNPASTTVIVLWKGDGLSGTIQLTDLLGRVIQEQELQRENRFDVFRLKPGLYSVRAKADGHKQQVERVVVNK